MTLERFVQPHTDGTVFVATGDIPDMWIRDSSVQLSPYLSLAQASPTVQRIIEGALKTQAKYIAIDPYANAYHDTYNTQEGFDSESRRLLRGGYVATANFELDSGPYFFRLLRDYGAAVPESDILADRQMHQAAKVLVQLYRVERRHNSSRYAYPLSPPYEMPGGPRGGKVGYTGMVWSGFRPSDDPHEYGYNIPGNIFLASQLPFVEQAAREVWGDQELAEDARELRRTILRGVQEFGLGRDAYGRSVYCYEVDGLGSCSLMDDANVPSLLSLPHIDPSGLHHDAEIYEHTRQFILSPANPWYFKGRKVRGIGSPHTGPNKVWPLALIMEAMTTKSVSERLNLVKLVLDTSYGNLLHESIDVDDPEHEHTRNDFAWPNALFSMLLHDAYGVSCGNAEDLPAIPAPTRRRLVSPWLRYSGVNFYTADPSLLRSRTIAL